MIRCQEMVFLLLKWTLKESPETLVLPLSVSREGKLLRLPAVVSLLGPDTCVGECSLIAQAAG